VSIAQKTPKRGRPSKLTPRLAAEIVAKLTAGASVTTAAAEVGISRRTFQMWRRRAYSRDPRDLAYVAVELA
jgi:Homeodomain-like domain